MVGRWVLRGWSAEWEVVASGEATADDRKRALPPRRAGKLVPHAVAGSDDARTRSTIVQILDGAATGALLDAHRVPMKQLILRLHDALASGAVMAVPVVRVAGAPAPTPKPPDQPDKPPADQPKTKEVVQLKWRAKEVQCGDSAFVDGTTANYPDGEALKVELKAEDGGAVPTLDAKVSGNSFSPEWKMADVASPKQGSKYLEKRKVTASAGGKSTADPLTVKFFPNADWDTFERRMTWNSFGNHAKFRQRHAEFVAEVEVSLDIMKAWSGIYVDLRSAGIKGTAGGITLDGHRWARGKGLSMTPVEYHDGKKWVPLPKGFTATAANYQTAAFVQESGKFTSGFGTWPEKFADYDFDSKEHTKTRKDWVDDVDKAWSKKFVLQRKGCKSKKGVACCRYDVTVKLILKTVTKKGDDVVLCAPGKLRSNSGLFHMPGSSKGVTPHEVGHHVDNPDEYKDGATDTTQKDGDGLKSGIDENSVMGQNMTPVKKRHYHAFAQMTQRLVKKAGGKDEEYVVADK
jgi:hypothetical protein